MGGGTLTSAWASIEIIRCRVFEKDARAGFGFRCLSRPSLPMDTSFMTFSLLCGFRNSIAGMNCDILKIWTVGRMSRQRSEVRGEPRPGPCSVTIDGRREHLGTHSRYMPAPNEAFHQRFAAKRSFCTERNQRGIHPGLVLGPRFRLAPGASMS